MTVIKRIAVAAAVTAAVAVLAGCGSFDEANDHNQPIKASDVRPGWTRIDSPPNYPTIVFACHGKDGIYIDQDSGTSPFVVPDDPECAK